MDGNKYRVLAPRAEYLEDVVVLAQAWKKSHTYIRRHNWYADTLELDSSAISLQTKLEEWAATIARRDYRPFPLGLVLAPKNAAWGFDAKSSGSWGPVDPEENRLRPLAHLGIRDQTIATSVMLCLADCIESAQGDTSLQPLQAGLAGVYSYGNRLYCRWQRDHHGRALARFSWGNSDTYSRYFQDYQRFVERPSFLAQHLRDSQLNPRSIYVVKFDLSAFYDNIDIPRLIESLKHEWASYRERDTELPVGDTDFWNLAEAALTFEWRAEDQARAYLLKDGRLPKGLPQGMVSSGFFANAYLLNFDRVVGAASMHADHSMGSLSFRVHDYCRYVDDLRLVVSVDPDISAESALTGQLTAWVQEKLDASLDTRAHGGRGLLLNPEKTEFEALPDLGGESGTAARMKSLQQQLSGPFDMAALQQAEAGLNGLLALAELSLHTRRVQEQSEDSLATVATAKLEIRDDTLTRFAAYRWVRSLRLRRRMTNLDARTGKGLASDILRHDFEMVARRLVAAWATNPALVQVLRYALDLFPSAKLLHPVVSSLKAHVNGIGAEYERHVALYVIAELLRAGATETGFRSSRDAEFPIGDLVAYREELVGVATFVLGLRDIPWYVTQQACLFLAAIGSVSEGIPDDYELWRYRVLHAFLAVRVEAADIDLNDVIAISIVGHQIIRQPSHYVSWFRKFAKGRSAREVSSALELIGQTDPDLLAAVTKPGAAAVRAGIMPAYLGAYLDVRRRIRADQLEDGKWLSLAHVLMHPSRPFSQENALLKLAQSLAVLFERQHPSPDAFTPLSVELRCDRWANLNNPAISQLAARVRNVKARPDPRYSTPSWCSNESAWMYSIGRLLRAAATGEPDFTTRQWLVREDAGWYSGIRSTWQQRRIGMMQTHTALRGTQAGITPWMTELLLRLLQWPGISTDESAFEALTDVNNPRALLNQVTTRLTHQQKLFGASSGLPVYVYPVAWKLSDSRHLRVAVIQGLMPEENDLEKGLDSLRAPSYRSKHRDHVATLLNIAHKKLLAREAIVGEAKKPMVDLVVLPEYCIHVDDQDLMRAFSDATGAMLFYGLLGATDPTSGLPINTARWLVPQRRSGRRSWLEIDQGKKHLTASEARLGVTSWRPYQVVVELQWGSGPGFRISGAICYDATDLALAADLKDVSHMFVVAAMNKDVKTFDSMVGALRYHMYQHVIIANSGEFGGSTAQAPYAIDHQRLVTHAHGSHQMSIAVFDVNVDHFGPRLLATDPAIAGISSQLGKTPPAGLMRSKV